MSAPTEMFSLPLVHNKKHDIFFTILRSIFSNLENIKRAPFAETLSPYIRLEKYAIDFHRDMFVSAIKNLCFFDNNPKP